MTTVRVADVASNDDFAPMLTSTVLHDKSSSGPPGVFKRWWPSLACSQAPRFDLVIIEPKRRIRNLSRSPFWRFQFREAFMRRLFRSLVFVGMVAALNVGLLWPIAQAQTEGTTEPIEPRWTPGVPGPVSPGGVSPPPYPDLNMQQRPMPGMEGSTSESGEGGGSVGMGKGRLEPMPEVDSQ